ncbi:type II toxin-antitoxin system VapC family toxin [Aquisphaera insulae]|uniref:type II toxin-antitoxin system VapC family toxin n=1 Tax=Aquisphaera insulae TaxID=2712864 RepID=UPI0013EAAFBC|nr:type II toxin-antitoxin system VapC family toxin [Aquisphaera insulae]
MTRFLLDTGIASDFINRRLRVFERARDETARGGRIGIAIPVLAELVAGIERNASRERNMGRLRRAIPALRVWPFDEDAAFEYGRIYAELLGIGRPMQTIDMMIAAVAFTLGNGVVITKDGDLAAIPGLTVDNGAE